MPRSLAILTIFLGAGVVAFGLVLPSIVTPLEDMPRAEPVPRVTLQPVTDNTKLDEVNGLVRTAFAPASDVRVELVPLFEGGKRLASRTDADGRFVFSDVDVTPGTPYVADVRFDGATFSSDVLRFGTSADEPVVIGVADTTKSSRDIRFDVESIAIVGDANGAQAVHAITVRNRGTRAYVGRLRLPLLPGANAIDPRGGLDRRKLELHGGEIVSVSPITPGRRDITYTYVAPMPKSGLMIRHETAYPTGRFELLVGGELTARRTNSRSGGSSVNIGERTYQRFEAHNLDPDDSLRFVVSVGRSSPVLRSAGLAAAALAALAIVAFPLLRRRRRSEVQTPPAHQPISVE